MTLPLVSAIIRIHASDDVVVGAGFLVADRYILTCVHLVANALGLLHDTPDPLQAELILDFPLLSMGQSVRARVIHWHLTADVAGLELIDALPIDAKPVGLLIKADELWGHSFRTFGFPAEHDNGVWVSGVIRGPQADGWLQIEDVKQTGYFVQPGFSGAPVWDEQLNGVVGMVVAADRKPEVKAAFIIPAKLLTEVWPRLTPTIRLHTQDLEDYLVALSTYYDQLPTLFDNLPFSRESFPRLSKIYVEQLLEEQSVPIELPHTDGSRKISEEENTQATPRTETTEQALERHRHLLLEGEPGMGKSTLLRQLTRTLAIAWWQNEVPPHNLPILIAARDLAAQDGSLGERLQRQVEEDLGGYLKAGLPTGFFSRALSQGINWLVLIDGLDEIVDLKVRTQLLQIIQHHAQNSLNHRFIITTRPIPDVGRFDRTGFGYYVMRPFGPDQLLEFAQNWFSARQNSDPKDYEGFIQQIKDSYLGDLVQVPLLLTIAAMVYQENPDKLLPTQRINLYEHSIKLLRKSGQGKIETLRQEWISEHGQEGKSWANCLINGDRKLLEHLALWFQTNGDGTLVDEAVGYMIDQHWIPETGIEQEWLKSQVGTFLRYTGLLTRRGNREYFIPDTFREYLTASTLANVYDPDGDEASNLVGQWKDEHWRQVILFLLAIWSQQGKDVTKLVRLIWGGGGNGFLFAGAILAEGVKVEAWVEEGIISLLLTRVNEIRFYDVYKRPNLIDILGTIRGREQIVRGLVSLIRDGTKDLLVRVAAVKAIGKLGHAEVLLGLARDHKAVTGIRWRVIEALGGLNRIDDLLNLALDVSMDEGIRLGATRALGILGQLEQAVPVLQDLAQSEAMEPELRMHAAANLGEFGDVELAENILISLANDTNVTADLKQASAQFLGNLGQREKAIPILLALAYNATLDVEVRAHSALTVGKFGQVEEASKILLSLIYNPSADLGERKFVVLALEQLGCADELLSVAQDINIDNYLRVLSAEALRKLDQTEQAIPILVDLAYRTRMSFWDSYEAVLALEKLGREGDLLTIARDERSDVDLRILIARELLPKLGHNEEAISILQSLAKDTEIGTKVKPRWTVQLSVARALGDLGSGDEAIAVLSAVKEGKIHVPFFADGVAIASQVSDQLVRTVEKLGRVDILLNWAKDVNIGIQIACAETLVKLGWIDFTIPILLSLAQSEDAHLSIRMRAVRVLGNLGMTEEVIPILFPIARRYVGREFGDVLLQQHSLTAAEMLGEFGRVEEAISLLLTIAYDWRVTWPGVRVRAAESLAKFGRTMEAETILLNLVYESCGRQKMVLAEPEMGIKSVKALGRLGQVDRLLEIVREKDISDWSIYNRKETSCEWATETLGKLGWAEEISSILLDIARDTEEELEQEWAARMSIKLVWSQEVETILLDIARNTDMGPGTRYRAIESLGEYGRTEKVRDVLFALIHESDLTKERYHSKNRIVSKDTMIEIYQQAIKSLAKLGCLDELLNLALDPQVNTHLRGHATAYAIQPLAESGRSDGLLTLAQEAGKGQGLEWKRRQEIEVNQPNKFRLFLSPIGHLETFRSCAASHAIEALETLNSTTELKALMHNSELDMQLRGYAALYAAKSLSKSGKMQKAGHILESVIRDGSINIGIRDLAANTLDELGQSERLLSLTRDPEVDEELRVKTAIAAGRLGHADKVAPVLLDLAQKDAFDQDSLPPFDLIYSSTSPLFALAELSRVEELSFLANENKLHPAIQITVAKFLGELGQVEQVMSILLELATRTTLDSGLHNRVVNILEVWDRVNELRVLALDTGLPVDRRIVAAKALGKLGEVDDATSILLTVANDVQVGLEMRLISSRILGELGQTEQATPLLRFLACTQKIDVEIRKRSAESLQELGQTEEAIQAWLSLAEDADVEPRVRMQAMKILIELGVLKKIFPILQVIACDKTIDVEIRKQSAETLQELKQTAEATQAWLSLAQDEHVKAEIRLSVIEILGDLHRINDAIFILRAMINNTNLEAEDRIAAARCLGKFGQVEEAASVILTLSRDTETDKRVSDVLRFDQLLGHTNDQGQWVLVRAANALMDLGYYEEARTIRDTLPWDLDVFAMSSIEGTGRSDWLKMRLASVKALGELEEVGHLRDLADDVEIGTEVRREVAETLARLGQVEDAFRIFVMLANDTKIEAKVRLSAAKSLVKLGQLENTLPILLELARDMRIAARIREDCAEMLAKYGHVNEAIAVLLDLARGARIYTGVRIDAVQTLIRLGFAQEMTSILIALASDNKIDCDNRIRAIKILERLNQIDTATKAWLAVARGEKYNEELRASIAEHLEEINRVKEASRIWLILARKGSRVGGQIHTDAISALRKLGRSQELWMLACSTKVVLWVRKEAAKALERLGNVEEAAQAWLVLSRDKNRDNWDRRQYPGNLARLGRVKELSELAFDTEVERDIRMNAAKFLGELGQVELAAQIWLAMVRNREPYMFDYRDALDALVTYKRSDELFILALDTGMDITIRMNVAEALEQFGQIEKAREAWLALTRSIQSDSEEMYHIAHAASALERLGQRKEAIQMWMSLAYNERAFPWDRLKAAEALGGLGRVDSSVRVCLDLAQNESADMRTRGEAIETLRELRQTDALLVLARDSTIQGVVREYAALILGSFSQVKDTTVIVLRTRAYIRQITISLLQKLIYSRFGFLFLRLFFRLRRLIWGEDEADY